MTEEQMLKKDEQMLNRVFCGNKAHILDQIDQDIERSNSNAMLFSGHEISDRYVKRASYLCRLYAYILDRG